MTMKFGKKSNKTFRDKPIIKIRTLINEFNKRLGKTEKKNVNIKDRSEEITLMQQ